MTKALLVAAAIALTAMPASADELTRAANLALVAQIADAVTTRENMRTAERGCLAVEHDPLARPFMRNDAVALVSTIAINFALRKAFSHAPKLLLGVAAGETVFAASNIARRGC